MSVFKEGAAPGKHHNDGPPRLNSSRCGMNVNSVTGLNQSSSGERNAITKKTEERMSQELAVREQEFAVIEQVVMAGDLSKLNAEQRVTYYRKVCEAQGLNPYSNPFAYLHLNGKLTLYAKKDCTEQLRKINGVSIEELDDKLIDDIYVVTAKARDKNGRVDQAKGAVVLAGLKGEQKANAIMKAETKAKRRVTLSICGMGWTDESEIDSIPNATPVDVDFTTGEIKGVAAREFKNTLPAPAPQPKLNAKQISELTMILDECEDKYKAWVYEYVEKTFKTKDLCGVDASMYDRMKAAAIKNMEKNYEMLSAMPKNETLEDLQLEMAEVAR